MVRSVYNKRRRKMRDIVEVVRSHAIQKTNLYFTDYKTAYGLYIVPSETTDLIDINFGSLTLTPAQAEMLLDIISKLI
jgi:hypothetical protein